MKKKSAEKKVWVCSLALSSKTAGVTCPPEECCCHEEGYCTARCKPCDATVYVPLRGRKLF